METSELLELIEKGEDSQTQFKERFGSIDALAAEICAFSNSNGGNIIVGVSDDGEITGLTKEEIHKLNEWVSSTCSQKIDPQVNVTTQNIKYPDKIVIGDQRTHWFEQVLHGKRQRHLGEGGGR